MAGGPPDPYFIDGLRFFDKTSMILSSEGYTSRF